LPIKIINSKRKEVNKMRKAMIVGSILLVTIFAVTIVYAQGLGFGKGQRICYFDERWGSQPQKISKLTPDQEARIIEIQRKFIEETAQLRGNMLTKRLELKTLWADPKADPEIIRVKEKELREIQNQLREKALEKRLEIRKILTPEQISQFGFHRGIGNKFGPEFGKHHGKAIGYGRQIGCW
jgi:Spy/CpxP family protein refolding chaperone